jgi:hypothetical protein
MFAPDRQADAQGSVFNDLPIEANTFTASPFASRRSTASSLSASCITYDASTMVGREPFSDAKCQILILKNASRGADWLTARTAQTSARPQMYRSQ